MNLLADDIARLTSTPLRTIQHRLARWAERGGPVVREPRPGRVGGYRLAVPLDAYCASRCVDRDEVLAALNAGA